MVRAEMLNVGRELLIGRTLNTNALWAGKRLAAMGTMLSQITTVDDDVGEIAASVKACLARAPDFLIIVGGLGPTPDDMTLKGVATGLGRKLTLNRGALAMIRERYVERGLGDVEITPARRKMAVFPEGARPVRNRAGTAPGVRLEVGRTVVFSLPGVPAEMRTIFRRSVEPEVRAKLGRLHRGYVSLRLEGIMESALAPMIAAELRKHPGAYIKSHPKGIENGLSKIILDIAVVGPIEEEADEAAGRIAAAMRSEIEVAGAKVSAARGPVPGAGDDLRRT
ncbi:MAG: molybdopterin-binding protein [Thaumarchaeota archaeon]|nr:molybdopterin-binding protein [Nitrososphaerota archaeon]